MLQAFASLATGIGTSETGNTGVLKREKFMNCKKVRAELRESVILDSRAVVLLSFFFFLVSLQRDVWQQFVAQSHTN